jgi:hypothetical protein
MSEYPDLEQPAQGAINAVIDGEWRGQSAMVMVNSSTVEASVPELTSILRSARMLRETIDIGPEPSRQIPIDPHDPRHLIAYLDGLADWITLVADPPEVISTPEESNDDSVETVF